MLLTDRQTDRHLQWVDALKGYGIFCVTFAHLNPLRPIETHIYSYHMFLFFFISGYLYKTQKLDYYLHKKTKSLLVPFLLWNLLSSLVEFYITHDLQDVVDRFLILHGKVCWNAPIWFLLILFLCESVYALADNAWRSIFTPHIVFCFSTVLWILYGQLNAPLKLNLLPLALFSFSFGKIFQGFTQRKVYSANSVNAMMLITAMLSILFGAILNQRISYTGATFGNLFYCFVAAISGCVFFTVLFKNCEQIGSNQYLCLLGKNSMTIMVMQYWLFRLFDFIGEKTFGISIWHGRSTLKALVVSIITILLILVFVGEIKKVLKKNKRMLYVSELFGIR